MNGISLFGSTGFVGSEFAARSIHEVDSVDRNFPSPKYSDVVYCIGTTDNYNVFSEPLLDIETNLIRLVKDLEILRDKFGVFNFNYLSSWFVYGDGAPPPFREAQPCNPKGFYSISKYAAEMFLASYCETYQINYRILRLANVFGPTDRGVSKKKNALQYLISQIKLNEPIDLYEGGEFVRDYIDVRDVVSAVDLIMDKAELNQIYNIGTGVPTRFLDLMVEAKRSFSSQSEFNRIVTPEFHKKVQVKDAYMDISKLASLGFTPKYRVIDEIVNL